MERPLVLPSKFARDVLDFDLYPIQEQVLDSMFEVGSRTSFMCANNGGKTSRILVALILWHLFTYPNGKVKTTSGSWIQIQDQLQPGLSRHKFNPLLVDDLEFMQTPHIRYKEETEYIGFWRGFSTKDPGRAEGDHGESADSPLLFIVDEAKTVPDNIFQAIGRCVDLDKYTRCIYASSPGWAEGEFFRSQQKRKDNPFKIFRQTAFDTPHISAEQIEAVRKRWQGFESYVNSMLGLDFMPMVENAVIDGKALDFCLGNPITWKPGDTHAFCDFAWSNDGDENVFAVCNGNRVTLEKCFYADNLPLIVATYIREFKRLGLKSGQISGDEGGGGKLIMDALDDEGYVLNRANNGSPGNDSEHYTTIAAEVWYEGAKRITDNDIILPNDTEMRAQMLNRKRIPGSKGRLAIESKKDMKKRNVPSPDRGDAVLGCIMPVSGYSQAGGGAPFAAPMTVGSYQSFGG